MIFECPFQLSYSILLWSLGVDPQVFNQLLLSILGHLHFFLPPLNLLKLHECSGKE